LFGQEKKMAKETARVVGVAQAARMLGLQMDYLYRLLQSGRLAAEKREGVWEIPVAAIEQRLKQREGRSG
jgi:excisionase family DNA binding protein